MKSFIWSMLQCGKKTMPIGAFIYFILGFWTVFPLVGFRISVWIDVIHDQRRRMGKISEQRELRYADKGWNIIYELVKFDSET